jgi:hypothetical protein
VRTKTKEGIMEKVTVLDQGETKGKSIIDVKDGISHIALKLAAIRMMFSTNGTAEGVSFSPYAQEGVCFMLDGLVDELQELTQI